MNIEDLLSIIDSPIQIELLLEFTRLKEVEISNLDFHLLDVAFSLDKKAQIISFYKEKEDEPKTFWMELQSKLQQMTTVEIRMSQIPQTDFYEKIVAFIKKEIGSHAVVDVKVEPQLLGGMTISYNGKYADYSLSTLWQDK